MDTRSPTVRQQGAAKMQLPTRLSRFIAKRGVAAAAAAVMMVGGGVAIAQNGTSDAEEPPGHEVARTAIDGSAGFDIGDFCEEHAPDAAFCAGLLEAEEVATDEPTTAEDADPQDVELLEDPEEETLDASDEETLEGSEEDDPENAELFSEWVREIPSEWGCIRGQLVSAAAQAGPLTSDFKTFLDELEGLEEGQEMFETAEAAAGALGLEGRCVEVVLEREGAEDNGNDNGNGNGNGNNGNGNNGNGNGEAEIGTAEHHDAGPPAHAGPPEGAGPNR